MTNKMQNEPTTVRGDYRTPDLYFAAYLMAKGSQVLQCKRDQGKMFWHFDIGAKASELDWMNGTGLVIARTYAEQIKNLKSMVHRPGED